MKITEVVPQKNTKHRVSVFVDNKYAFSLDETDAVFMKIKPGREITQSEIQNCIMEGNFTKARDCALGILSSKPITEKLLCDKLSEKGYDEAVVTEVVRELSELGYVNDYDYAALFLEHCVSKMWGRSKIKYEMKQKGIDDRIVEEILDNFDDADLTDDMTDAIISKYGSDDLTDIKTKARVTRYFASRGFGFSEIDAALRRAIALTEEN